MVNMRCDKRLFAFCSAALVLFLFVPLYAFGNGFYIYEQGAKAVGMGGAFVAQADDPSAVFYNPAGISQLKGTQIMAGISPIMPSSTFESDGATPLGAAGRTWDAEDHTWVIPHFYVTHKLNDKISFALGSYSNFGLGTEWPDDFEGKFITGAGKAFIRTVTISPIMSYEPIKGLSFGAGPTYRHIDISLRNKLLFGADPATSPTGTSRLDGNDWDWGYVVGVRYQITPSLSAGASYLSEVTHDLHSGVSKVNYPNGITSRQGASAKLTLPATASFGLAYKFSALTLEADAQWTEWSSYEKLRVELEDGRSMESRKNWHNTWTLRFGGQYALNKYVDLRAGVVWDETPIPRETLDPLVPSGNRWLYCAGLGINLGNLTFDLAYNYLDDQNRRWNNEAGNIRTVTGTTVDRVTGEFKDTHAHIISLSTRYQF